ncbi:hypothetical protein NPIL_80591 [Nephila pilipes]|uniref:Uncharacterized protein n=1 Tax=Nephila pilipes TaxID=299642 RepID=A0A8X6UMK2_NEPPI|nr:hypothetical protein NPIL_80591 [Nephila pilipes]
MSPFKINILRPALSLCSPGQLLRNHSSLDILRASGSRDILRASLGPFIVIKHSMKGPDYLSIILDQCHPYITPVFTTWNRVFLPNDTLSHKAENDLQRFKKYADEFQWILLYSNSTDFNPREDAWNAM